MVVILVEWKSINFMSFVHSVVGRPRWSLAAAGRDHALPLMLRAVRSQRGRLRRRKMIHPTERHMRLPTALATGDPWGGGSGGGPQRRARTRIPRRPHHQRPCHPPPSPWPVAPQGQAMSGFSSKVSPITLHLFLQIMQQQCD